MKAAIKAIEEKFELIIQERDKTLGELKEETKVLKAKNDVLEKTYKDSVKEMNIRIQEEQVLKAEIEELKNVEKVEKSEKKTKEKGFEDLTLKTW